jgi:hypothetical protein
MDFSQSFESVNSIPFAGKTVTLSFYARAGANYSATGNTLNAFIYAGTGTDQSIVVSYTGITGAVSTSQALTTTWQRFTATGTIPTTATEMAVYIIGTPTGTAGANDFYEVTGVQIDLGSVALPFRTYAATIQGELAACQRYFVRLNTNSSSFIGQGMARSGTVFGLFGAVPLPTTMRTAPSLTYSGLNMEPNAGGGFAVTSLTASTSVNNAGFFATQASNFGANDGLLLRGTSSNNFLDASAEL